MQGQMREGRQMEGWEQEKREEVNVPPREGAWVGV
jgi:hypothetical protein